MTTVDILNKLELNEDRFIALLGKIIGDVEKLQNAPHLGLVPQEDLVCAHVKEAISPYLKENGGVLECEQVTYVEGRSNLLIKYPKDEAAAAAAEDVVPTLAFVGSHMDVVPADPETWDFSPFELTREGDQLRGRGTTDCEGHVAMITEFFISLAEAKPALPFDVHAVFIASEEAESNPPEAGVESLVKHGRLAMLKNGPILWVDSADTQPCIGTAGALQWHCRVDGRLFHSGLPHRGVNPIELANAVINELQSRFYKKYPEHPSEKSYNFSVPSTFKPTQINCAPGGLNQIPPWCTVSGDIRLLPFYDVEDVHKSFDEWVKELNENVESLPSHGISKFVINQEGVEYRGKIDWQWGETALEGIACDLESPGHKCLLKSTEDVLGKAEPYAISGSLPLVRQMSREGFDVQISGYGLSTVYHGVNEYCKLSDMQNGFKIFASMIRRLATKDY